MRHRAIAATAVVMLAALATSAAAQTAPKTAWGDPDLGGIWDFRTITPLQRPRDLADQEFLTEEQAANLEQEVIERNEELADRPAERTEAAEQVDRRADGSPGFYNNFWLDQGTQTVETRRTSLIIDPPDGRVPDMTEAAQARAAEEREYRQAHPADSWLDRSTSDRCLLGFNAGPPLSPGGYNQNLQIFQTPDHVVLLTEMVHTHRVVPLDGRPRIPDHVAQWSGDARGHWEGETLVVETRNFDPDRRWRNTTESLTLVERFTRVDEDILAYEYTVTDPSVWERSWTAQIPLRRTDVPMFEYACHEGNHSMEGILAGARADERAAAGGQ